MALIAFGVSVFTCVFAYQQNSDKKDEIAFTNPLFEENLQALADRPGFWAGLVDPCVKNFTGTTRENIYGSSSSSNSNSSSSSDKVGGSYNPATGGVSGNVEHSQSNSNSSSNEGNNLIGQVIDCSGWSCSNCHLGDCTIYENGAIKKAYPDCASQL